MQIFPSVKQTNDNKTDLAVRGMAEAEMGAKNRPQKGISTGATISLRGEREN